MGIVFLGNISDSLNVVISISPSNTQQPRRNLSSIICQICFTEKMWINNEDFLNEEPELSNKCEHLNKFLLANVKNR